MVDSAPGTTYDGVTLQTSTAVEGSRHDFAIFKESAPAFPENLPHGQGIEPDRQCLRHLRYIADGAYAGMERIVSQRGSRVSRKRKPGRELTPAEKEYDRALAKMRIRVEHAMRRAKAFRVMGDRYRNPRKKYALINDIVCGLANMVRLWERAATWQRGRGRIRQGRCAYLPNCGSCLAAMYVWRPFRRSGRARRVFRWFARVAGQCVEASPNPGSVSTHIVQQT